MRRVIRAALEAMCRVTGAGLVVVAGGQRPRLVAGEPMPLLRATGLVDRAGAPRPRLAALLDLATGSGKARSVFPAGARRAVEVVIAPLVAGRLEAAGRDRRPSRPRRKGPARREAGPPAADPLFAVVVRSRPALAPAQAPSREGAVAARVAEGLSNKEIAVALGITERAVKKHIERARGRLGARNRAHLVALLRTAQAG